MPRPRGSADLLEDRRRRALALLRAGYSLHETGRRIGCNASMVINENAWCSSSFKELDSMFLGTRKIGFTDHHR